MPLTAEPYVRCTSLAELSFPWRAELPGLWHARETSAATPRSGAVRMRFGGATRFRAGRIQGHVLRRRAAGQPGEDRPEAARLAAGLADRLREPVQHDRDQADADAAQRREPASETADSLEHEAAETPGDAQGGAHHPHNQ